MAQATPVRAKDEPFLLELYAATRRAEVAAWGWDPAQQEAFLQMQFQLQRRSYDLQYPDADHRVIWAAGRPAGRIIVHRGAGELRLVDLAFLPDCRGLGLGTDVLRDLQAEAAAAGKPLRLSVLKSNGSARRLYERLGFVTTGESDLYCAMEWQPIVAPSNSPA